MKVLKQLGVLVISLIAQNLSGQALLINQGSAINPNGHFHNQEWTDANSFVFAINSNRSTTVYIKHDGQNLNIAFAGNLQTGGTYFPEIMIDPNHSHDGNIQADDWWFHVSATDCEYQGQYGNYNNCQLIRPNWTAKPNFQQGLIVDTVEIQIPFSTLGIQAIDTIGIAFLLNNFQSLLKFPASANHLNPSTWASGLLSASTGIKGERSSDKLQLFPNPSNGKIQVNLNEELVVYNELIIRNIIGEEVYKKSISSFPLRLNLSHLEKGMYFIFLENENEQFSKKLILID